MRTIRILSLDGGGIRGLFQAYFIQQFCEQAGIKGNDLWKYFDIITGTSIGGISALGYANGLSPTELVNILNTQGPLIFPYKSWTIGSIGYQTGPANSAAIALNVSTYGYVYNNEPLLAAATEVLGSTKMFQLKTNVLITSVLVQNDIFDGFKNYVPWMFSNVITPYTNGQSYLATDIAMATSAAPAFFPAWSISEDINPNPNIKNVFVDGGLYQNNPTALTYSISKILYPGNNKICILSVGTGVDKSDPLIPTETTTQNLKGAASLPVLLSNSLTATIGGAQDAVSKQFDIQSLYDNNGFYYYRFQTILDPTKGNQLDNATAEYRTYLKTAAEIQYKIDQLKISIFIENAGF